MREPGNETSEITLSVIVPVYDQEDVILANVRVICERVAAGLGDSFEVIVVSDGSLDSTAERVLEGEVERVRVLHYDRNLGKGYAVKTGAREARGRWIGYVDADLDLDPASLPAFVAAGERESQDFVVGSKRHPDSHVHYPRSRVVASWLFQQLVRLLFRLNVTDSQVGLKVFRREIADDVLPLLLVKRYAFDIELLAVAGAFGYRRVKEMPVVLEYQFSRSGVRSIAVLFALMDTAAIFYRLRILRYYQRRRARAGASAWALPDGFRGTTAVVTEDTVEGRRRAVESSDAEIVAFLEPGARPSANWLTSTTPFFARPDLDVIVTPQLAPAGGRVRERTATSIAESRLGSGSLYYRFTPGSIRFVSDFPARSFLVRRERFLSLPDSTAPESVILELTQTGPGALYVPEASVTSPQAPLFLPHLQRVARYGGSRGRVVRQRGLRALRPSTAAAVAWLAWMLFGWLLLLAGPTATDALITVWACYALAVGVASLLGGMRFYSLRVALVMAVGLPLTHAVYALSFVRGFALPRRRLPWAHA